MRYDETTDFVIVGSGGGSFCAGLVCADQGKHALILEKTERVGGSTAMSGGVLWIPNHPLQQAAGVADSFEAGIAYMNACIGDVGPASSPARRDAFLRGGPSMIRYLQGKGIPFIRCEGWSDYHDELEGGCARGRSLMVKLFDAKELGPDARQLLRRGAMALPLQGTESWRLQIPYTFDGVHAAMNLGLRTALMKLTARDLVGVGMALQGRMLQAALRAKVDVRANAPVVELCIESGRVTGVVAEIAGRRKTIGARSGVLLNSGGFARNAGMRERYGPHPATTEWTNANPGDTGEVLQMAQSLGAAVALMDQAIWVPTSVQPDGTLAWHVFDTPKPHVMMVNRAGKRFLNEAESYMAKGQAMYADGAIPCYAIMDASHRGNYFWGATPPGKPPEQWLTSGYMKRADTLAELARLSGIDPAGLTASVARFNEHARAGRDPDFQRGERAYDRIFGDKRVTPNPSLGPVEKPPFYAVEVVPGDVGTVGGLLTDEFARVLKEDGAPVAGLYAVGNCAASLMGKSYPGAGASIAPSFVFGWIAARHALRESPVGVATSGSGLVTPMALASGH